MENEGFFTAGRMMRFGVAFIFDIFKFFFGLLVFTEPLAEITDVIAWMILSLWLASVGVLKFSGPGSTAKYASWAVSATVGLIPFLNMLPTITIGVIAIEYQQQGQVKAAAMKKSKQMSRSRQQKIIAQQAAQLQATAQKEATTDTPEEPSSEVS